MTYLIKKFKKIKKSKNQNVFSSTVDTFHRTQRRLGGFGFDCDCDRCTCMREHEELSDAEDLLRAKWYFFFINKSRNLKITKKK